MIKRKKSKSENEAEKPPGISSRSRGEQALHYVLVLMVVVCVLIVISAFVCILGANLKIYDMTAEISKYLDDKGLTADIKRVGQCFIDRLEAYSKSLMEASTVSFLIAVLSAGVIAYAVSLINRAHREINNMKTRIDQLSGEAQRNVNAAGEKVEELEATTKAVKESADRFFDSIVIDWEISTCLSKAQQMSRRLRRVSDKKTFDSIVPDVRDHLNYVYRDLEYAKKNRIELNQPLCQDFHNQVLDTRMDLESVPDRFRDKVIDLIDRCDKIIILLEEFFSDCK